MGQRLHPKDNTASTLSSQLNALARLFLRLGTIGFGGPQAHIAMIHDEAVVRRGWLTEDQFIEGLAICELLPGPASTQMGLYVGYTRAGQLGAIVAGVCFILPAFLIVLTLSWAYFRFQGIPQIEDLFLGISPVVIAIIVGFCWKLSKKTIKDWQGGAIALVVLVVTFLFQANVLLLFILAGLVGLGIYRSRPPMPPPALPSSSARVWLVPPLPIIGQIPYLLANLPQAPLALSSFWGLERIHDYGLPLTLFFLKVGSFIFGGGLVIIPLLEAEVVGQLHWLTRSEFIDGVAIGEFTPGPVVITAAFVGYKVAGVLGALVATIAIFTPSFVLIMGASPLLRRIRQNPWLKAFLKGVTPAVLGAIAAATLPLAQAAIFQDTIARTGIVAIIGIVALIALIFFKRPTWQLVPAGAIIGLGVGTWL